MYNSLIDAPSTSSDLPMLSLAIGYYKRFKMEAPLAGLPRPIFPSGYAPVAWRPDLLNDHADVLARCFADTLDAVIFLSLASREGCVGLMTEVTRRRAFVPEATWLVIGPDGPCGSVQVLRDRPGLAAIQNIGIVPEARGRGLGRALLLQSLHGMYDAGFGRAVLEVTANNSAAIRLYDQVGFRRARVVYKAVSALPPGESEGAGI